VANSIDDYLNLIPSENRDKPNFLATMTTLVELSAYMQTLLENIQALNGLFDVDTAKGEQLDFIGQWVGISRAVEVPISGVWFSWDSPDPTLGWDSGSWEGADGITLLPDNSYRLLIKAKIAANHWDGTVPTAYMIWSIVFPGTIILIQDYQDMSYSILIGGLIDALNKALIIRGYIPLKPEGVRIREYFFPFDSGPVFAWDSESTYLGGWDEASWAAEYEPV
jgi:hypothetical protein